MDGVQLTRAVKADPALASTRVVLLTSTGEDVGRIAREAGVEVWLTKPVRQSQLYDCLATIGGVDTRSNEGTEPLRPPQSRAARGPERRLVSSSPRTTS